MDNYELELSDPVGARKIVAARTLVVDPNTGELSAKEPPFEVCFRDAKQLIRPVAPFLEVWVRWTGENVLVPLTLAALGAEFSDAAVTWQVRVGNLKAYRHTADANDKVEASTGEFSDHAVKELKGCCENFLKNKYIPFGGVQYIKPNDKFPEIRLRFTPAGGKVYGPPSSYGHPDSNLAGVVYDDKKGKWKGYLDVHADNLASRRTTNLAMSMRDGWTTKAICIAGDIWTMSAMELWK